MHGWSFACPFVHAGPPSMEWPAEVRAGGGEDRRQMMNDGGLRLWRVKRLAARSSILCPSKRRLGGCLAHKCKYAAIFCACVILRQAEEGVNEIRKKIKILCHRAVARAYIQVLRA
jgi:hypothetical protein